MELPLNWKKYLTDYAWLSGVVLAIILLDQSTKTWVRSNLTYAEIYRPDLWLSQVARIIHWGNTGTFNGWFQDKSDSFVVLSFVVGLAILYYFPQVPADERLLRLGMGLQLGGATGNLIDRLFHGYVLDFISIGEFPVLNLADASLLVGLALLVIGMWLHERKQKMLETPA